MTLIEGLRAGSGTNWQLAMRTGVGVSAARQTLDNMCRAGEVHKPRSVRMPGVCRPVPVYELVDVDLRREAEAPGLAVQRLMRAWVAPTNDGEASPE